MMCLLLTVSSVSRLSEELPLSSLTTSGVFAELESFHTAAVLVICELKVLKCQRLQGTG